MPDPIVEGQVAVLGQVNTNERKSFSFAQVKRDGTRKVPRAGEFIDPGFSVIPYLPAVLVGETYPR